MDRQGLPEVTCEVRLVRAAAHHDDRPWTATADVRFGSRTIVASAEEATGHEVVDQLQDRLRRQLDKAVHAWSAGRRATASPWRGGGTPDTPVA